MHSLLGERFILIRLFRRDNLPKIFGSSEYTKATLRFAWHLTSVAWIGFAMILVHIANPPINANVIGNIIGVTFLIHGGVALVGSKARHLSWVVFLVVGVASIYASNI